MTSITKDQVTNILGWDRKRGVTKKLAYDRLGLTREGYRLWPHKIAEDDKRYLLILGAIEFWDLKKRARRVLDV